MTPRPTQEQYQRALDFYKADTPIETIGERLGLDEETLEQLEHEGWPQAGSSPALPALRMQVLERLTRIRVGQLDTYANIVEAAAKSSETRRRSIMLASQIENAIMSVWAAKVTTATKDKQLGKVDLDSLTVPASVRESLLALRRVQDPSHDKRYVEIFTRMSQRDDGGDGDGDTFEDAIMRDLSGLTVDELEEYVRTKKIPKRQRELPFPKTPAKEDAA